MRTSEYADWYRNGPLSGHAVDVFATVALGSTLVAATQPAGDMSDPAIDEIVLVYDLGYNRLTRAVLDAGSGLIDEKHSSHKMIVFPANFANSIFINQAHSILALSIPSAAIRQALDDARLPPNLDFGHLHAGMFQDSFLVNGLIRMRDWCAPEHAGFGLAREGLLLAMLLRLAELAGNAKRPAWPRKHAALTAWQVKRVTDLLQANLAACPALEDLAQAVNLSKYHFCRAFSQTVGCSPMQYLIEQRVAHATALLQSSKQSIADIAAQIGYDDPSYFSRLYRHKTGLMPKAVRQSKWLPRKSERPVSER